MSHKNYIIKGGATKRIEEERIRDWRKTLWADSDPMRRGD